MGLEVLLGALLVSIEGANEDGIKVVGKDRGGGVMGHYSILRRGRGDGTGCDENVR